MPDPDPKQNQGQGQSQDQQGSKQSSQKVQVGDKEYSSADVQNMLSQLQSNTQTVQKVQSVINMCERYGLDPDQFVQQAEGAFTVVGNLIQDGVIDRQGNLVKPGQKAQAEDHGSGFQTHDQNLSPDAKFLKDTFAQLKTTMDGLGGKIKEMEEVQTSMLRDKFHEKIQRTYPMLSDDDISRVFSSAMRDKTKTLFQHAKEAAEYKKGVMGELRKKHAEEFGVNLDEFDQNKLHMQDPRGAAVARFQGKKFSLKPKEGAVTARDAMKEYFKHANVGGQ